VLARVTVTVEVVKVVSTMFELVTVKGIVVMMIVELEEI